MESLRDRLRKLSQQCGPGRAAAHELALAAARMALEDAEQECADEEIYPEERWGGIYNVAVKSCVTAIRTLRDGLSNV